MALRPWWMLHRLTLIWAIVIATALLEANSIFTIAGLLRRDEQIEIVEDPFSAPPGSTILLHSPTMRFGWPYSPLTRRAGIANAAFATFLILLSSVKVELIQRAGRRLVTVQNLLVLTGLLAFILVISRLENGWHNYSDGMSPLAHHIAGFEITATRVIVDCSFVLAWFGLVEGIAALFRRHDSGNL